MSDTEFEQLLAALRPGLHRYCARMTGSAIDGEDVVQDALVKAWSGRPAAGVLEHPRAWLFRIAHNAALDFLRRRGKVAPVDPDADGDAGLPAAPALPDPDIAAVCLRSFLQLPPLQRSAVILKDVLDHSLDEAAAVLGASAPAVKSALQRGRERLRTLAPDPRAMATLDAATQARLAAYVDGFRTGDVDAIRAMLAEDVQLDLVARLKRSGKGQVGEYLGRYRESRQWRYAPGVVEGRPAMLVFDCAVSRAAPAYFVALDFDGDCVAGIRDFLFARYAMEGAEADTLADAAPSGVNRLY